MKVIVTILALVATVLIGQAVFSGVFDPLPRWISVGFFVLTTLFLCYVTSVFWKFPPSPNKKDFATEAGRVLADGGETDYYRKEL